MSFLISSNRHVTLVSALQFEQEMYINTCWIHATISSPRTHYWVTERRYTTQNKMRKETNSYIFLQNIKHVPVCEDTLRCGIGCSFLIYPQSTLLFYVTKHPETINAFFLQFFSSLMIMVSNLSITEDARILRCYKGCCRWKKLQ